MREIAISIDVFALIWSLRQPNELTENDVLARILKEHLEGRCPQGDNQSQAIRLNGPSRFGNELDSVARVKKEGNNSKLSELEVLDAAELVVGKIRWVDDIWSALSAHGGRATLSTIYKEVEKRRKDSKRSIPRTLEAIIRRTLEDHSSDSANFRGTDLFAIIGRGEWAIRDLSSRGK